MRERLDPRIFAWVAEALAERGVSSTRLAGYYNYNQVVWHRGARYLVRAPIPGAEPMDARPLPETIVLDFLARWEYPAPRLACEAADGSYRVFEFVPGRCLDALYPREQPLTDELVLGLADLLRRLHGLPATELARPAWMAAPEGRGDLVLAGLLAEVEETHRRFLPSHGRLFAALGVPERPGADLASLAGRIGRRAFVVGHGDAHRKNIVIDAAQRMVLVDWEMARVTDPVFDLAVHFHKMGYRPDQERRFWRRYQEGADRSTGGWTDQIGCYLRALWVKSAVVDSVRYAEEARPVSGDAAGVFGFAERLADKLALARVVWRPPAREAACTPAEIAAVLIRFGEGALI